MAPTNYFYERTKDNEPSRLLRQAVALLPLRGYALDLGCGAGRDVKFLVEHGFHVTAVDKDEEALPYLAVFPPEQVHWVHSAFAQFDFVPSTYDLITAQWSLPFQQPAVFEEVFTRLREALRPGGIFSGHFFGVNDEWNTPGSSFTFLTQGQARAVLQGLSLHVFREGERDSTTADGTPKHWHTFHIIAQR
ncbi:class I SAM-dependent DNA methyltransferase [Ktedonobacter racemifer]|uniref:Methyltransferase type 11 n=1 Tax=Ktedonobacter racemifer DSM 44963 TaxID=485913 RepID=D6TPR0_KTERA|nr:class I SAM-dependent methyltransferase [Ktedonobacter racemifer]EFH85674.1 Methyltransferase type 11 [Ktedonobacter racemifer DSM 44963]